MQTIRTLAALALAWAALAAQADSGHAHHRPPSAAAPEQQDWGIAGDPRAVRRTIAITMTDAMRFRPDRITVREGDTVRLRVTNAGRMQHELVLGTRQALEQHAALMQQHPGMEHDEAHMAHVAPGKTGELVWTFNRAGEFNYACLVPGHYQAGMVGSISVAPATREKAK